MNPRWGRCCSVYMYRKFCKRKHFVIQMFNPYVINIVGKKDRRKEWHNHIVCKICRYSNVWFAIPKKIQPIGICTVSNLRSNKIVLNFFIENKCYLCTNNILTLRRTFSGLSLNEIISQDRPGAIALKTAMRNEVRDCIFRQHQRYNSCYFHSRHYRGHDVMNKDFKLTHSVSYTGETSPSTNAVPSSLLTLLSIPLRALIFVLLTYFVVFCWKHIPPSSNESSLSFPRSGVSKSLQTTRGPSVRNWTEQKLMFPWECKSDKPTLSDKPFIRRTWYETGRRNRQYSPT